MFAALILFCAGSLTNAKLVCLPSSMTVFFVALITLVWLQWAGGFIAYSGDALVSTLFLAGMGMAWWLGARTKLLASALQLDRVLIFAASLMVAAACVSTFMAILQWLNQDGGIWVFVAERGPNRPYANLGQPNLLATLLVMGVVYAYLLYERHRIKTWQLLVISVWLGFGLIVTESLAGLLSAFCIGGFFLVRVRPHWHVGGWRLVVTWWCLLALLGTVWRPINELLLLLTTRQASIVVDNVRVTMWEQIIAAISESPWLGYGWRQTHIAQTVGVEWIPGTLQTDYAHNGVLDILAWVGVPLGALLVTLSAWWLWRTVRDIKNAREFLLFGSTIPFLLHSMVEFPYAYAFFLFPEAWVFGFLHASQMPHKFLVGHTTPLIKKSKTILGLLCFTVLCGAVLREYFAVEEDFRVLRFEVRNLGSRSPDYKAPELFFLTQLDDLLKMGRMQPTRGMSVSEIKQLGRASLGRHWAALNMKYVIALAINGQPDEATKQLRNIRTFYGVELYRSAVDEIRTLRDKKYPELSLVDIQY